MKSTYVDSDGTVRCPACGAKDSFTAKRTGKAKLMGVATVGVGVLAAPKRLKCNGCGTNLKRSGSSQKTRRETLDRLKADRAELREVRERSRAEGMSQLQAHNAVRAAAAEQRRR